MDEAKFDDYKSFDFSIEKMKIIVFLYTFFFSVKFNNMFFWSILCFCLKKIVSFEILLSKKALELIYNKDFLYFLYFYSFYIL